MYPVVDADINFSKSPPEVAPVTRHSPRKQAHSNKRFDPYEFTSDGEFSPVKLSSGQRYAGITIFIQSYPKR